jgi:hypothetical protein
VSKAESTLRRELCKRVRGAGGHAQPIEDALSSGVPDVNTCINGVESWVELKTGHKLSTEQRKWLAARARAYGRVFVLQQSGKRLLLLDGVSAALYLDKDWSKVIVVAEGWDNVVRALGLDPEYFKIAENQER